LVSASEELLSDALKMLRKIVAPDSGAQAPETSYFKDLDCPAASKPIIGGDPPDINDF